MSKERCETCRFFLARTKRPRPGFSVRYGECRRFPPLALVEPSAHHVPATFAFPAVHSDVWCGEWQSRAAEQKT